MYPQVQHGELLEVSFTPTLDTSIYASGDSLFATPAPLIVTRFPGAFVQLVDAKVVDIAGQASALDILFFRGTAAPTVAAANAAVTLSDADAANVEGWVPLAAADYVALQGSGGNSFGQYDGLFEPGLVMKPSDAETRLWCWVIAKGTPTYGAASLTFRFKFRTLAARQ